MRHTPHNQRQTNNNNNTSLHSSVSLFALDFFRVNFMWAADGAAHASAAKRRHRADLKYVRMSVAMVLSEYKHHTSRGQNMDRAGVWGRALNYTATFRDPPPPPRAKYTAKFRKHSSPTSPAHSTLRLTMTTVCRSSEAPGLYEVRPLERVLRHRGADWRRRSSAQDPLGLDYAPFR